jgi:hypothetical protein
MNKTLLNILKSREDLSDYLFHFTYGKSAKDTLKKITNEKHLKDVNNRGFICLTEAPLLSLTGMFKIFKRYENPMYAPYGVAMKKDFLFTLGGRSVIYGPLAEKDLLDDSIKWRFEEYIPEKKDFTWLREWRVPVKEIQLTVDNCFIITKNEMELHELMFSMENIGDVEFDGCVSDGRFWGTASGIVERTFKGVSLEDINKLENLSKSEIDKLIASQVKTDKRNISLGGFII